MDEEDKCNLRTPKRATAHPFPVDEDFISICRVCDLLSTRRPTLNPKFHDFGNFFQQPPNEPQKSRQTYLQGKLDRADKTNLCRPYLNDRSLFLLFNDTLSTAYVTA
jgi:hypothetical protein